jgi:hypothetical protein
VDQLNTKRHILNTLLDGGDFRSEEWEQLAKEFEDGERPHGAAALRTKAAHYSKP